MGLFRRRDEVNDELSHLQQSIRNRGQAPIAEAIATTNEYLRHVLVDASAADSQQAAEFAEDWLRFFLAFGTVGWFKLLDPLPEGPQLRAEFMALVQDRQRFGPGHIVAWWWNLQPDLFKGTVDNQLNEMRGALTDNVRDASSRSDFSNRPGWEMFAA
jgi:hypothetical protein